MPRFSRMCVLLLPLLACAPAKVKQSNNKWENGLVVASNMCARDGSVQHTKDPEGQRIYCGFEELIGSHIPKCVCYDEQESAQRRAESQQYFREAEQSRQLVHGN